jgi:hypothetical protein
MPTGAKEKFYFGIHKLKIQFQFLDINEQKLEQDSQDGGSIWGIWE